ncbi:uncharacterized protein LOC130940036 [Arachis stenosperma]|uniref:uncharacterized protein LOC130940036 n=1 Tax=Arachis stenosperma TaxID=217475 RepID=UPI0025ACE688|nr:uncharacterized protein LOC130940036 [Arachis stenosperma]
MDITTPNNINNRYHHFEQSHSHTSVGIKNDEVKNGLYMTIVALIATETYQAVITPPGGLWQDDSALHRAGKSIMGSHHPGEFVIFVIGNSICFYSSLLSMIYILLESSKNYAILASLYALSFTYGFNVAAIQPDAVRARWGKFISFFFFVLTILGPFLYSKLWSASSRTHQQSDQ